MFQMTQCWGVLNISSLALRPALEQMMRQPLVKHITWGEVRQQFASWRGKWSWWQMIDKKWFVVGFQRSTFWQFFPWRPWFWWRFWIQKARGQSFLHIVAVFIHIDKCIWPSHITGESMVNRWLHVLRAWTNHPSWDIHQPRSGSPTGKADIRRQHMQSQASKLLGSWKKPSKNASKLRCKRAKLSQAHTVCGARTGKLCIRRCARPQHLASRKMTGILWIKEDLPAFFLRKADGILSYRQ